MTVKPGTEAEPSNREQEWTDSSDEEDAYEDVRYPSNQAASTEHQPLEEIGNLKDRLSSVLDSTGQFETRSKSMGDKPDQFESSSKPVGDPSISGKRPLEDMPPLLEKPLKRSNEWEGRYEDGPFQDEEDLTWVEELNVHCSQLAAAFDGPPQALDGVLKAFASSARAYKILSAATFDAGKGLVLIGTARVDPSRFKDALVCLHSYGCPEEVIRSICRVLRKCRRFDVLFELATSLVPILLSKVEKLPSLPELSEMVANSNLPLVCELGLGGGPFVKEVASKYGFNKDEQLLEKAMRQSAFVLNAESMKAYSVGTGHEFPWFEGSFRLVEEVRGSPDAIWWLKLHCVERVTARPAKAFFAGSSSSWSGDLYASDLGGKLLLHEDDSLRMFEGSIFRESINGCITGAEGEKHGLLGSRMKKECSSLDYNLSSPSLKDCDDAKPNDVTLSDGAFLDTCQRFQFGEIFSVDLWFRVSPSCTFDTAMTLISNGTFSLSIQRGFDAIIIENKDDEALKDGSAKIPIDIRDGTRFEWHYLCVTSSSASTEILLDETKTEIPSRKSALGSVAKNLYLGAHHETGNDSFEGALCDVRVWNRTLDGAEIERHRRRGASLDQKHGLSGCVAWYGLVCGNDESARYACLENLIQPARPLCCRPSLSAIRSESVCPVKRRDSCLIGDGGNLWLHRESELHQFVWARGLIANVVLGFESLVRVSTGDDKLRRFTLRLHQASWFQHADHPVFEPLGPAVTDCPAASLTLWSEPDSDKYILESAIRTRHGTIKNRLKVTHLDFPGLLKDPSFAFVFKDDSLGVYESKSHKMIAEVPWSLSMLVSSAETGEDDKLFLVGMELESAFSPPMVSAFHIKAARTVQESTSSGGNEEEEIQKARPNRCDTCLLESSNCVCVQSTAPDKQINDQILRTDWPCEVCTFINPNSALRCDACGSASPQSRRQPPPPEVLVSPPPPPPAQPLMAIERACPVCTVINSSTAVVCFVCDSPLPQLPVANLPVAPLTGHMSVGAQADPRSSSSNPPATSSRLSSPQVKRFIGGFLVSKAGSASTAETMLWDSTSGLFTAVIEDSEEVIFHCKGSLEGASVVCTAKFSPTLQQWKIEGNRPGDGFQFDLVLDAFGETLLSGNFRGALREGRWALGEYVPLYKVLKGLSAPSAPFKVGLENMITGLTNVCSENAVIQALFACTEIRDLILSEASRKALSENVDDEGMKVFRALHSLFTEMTTTPRRYIQARELQRVLPDKYKQGDQMDATEFLSDVMHALEQGLGDSALQDLVRFPRQTELKCVSCGSSKVTGKEDPSVIILPFPKQYQPITNIYVFVCANPSELPPRIIPGKSSTADMIRLTQSLNGEEFPQVYLYLERDPSNPSAVPVTDIQVGSHVNLLVLPGYEQAEVHTVHGLRTVSKGASLQGIPNTALVYIKRGHQNNPITDVQLLVGVDTPVPAGYQLIRPPATSTSGSLSLVPVPAGVRVVYCMDMPVMDVFVGTMEEKLRRRLQGYTQCPVALGEEADTGKEVYMFFASHLGRPNGQQEGIGRVPPVFNLFVHEEEEDGANRENAPAVAQHDAADEADEDSPFLGRIAGGSKKRFYLRQARTGVGCPITKIAVFDALTPASSASSGFSEFIDLVKTCAEDEMSFVVSFEQCHFSPSIPRELRLQSKRFTSLLGVHDGVTYREVRGTVGTGSSSHAFEGIVYRLLSKPQSPLMLLGDFQTGHGDLLQAEWSSSTQKWSSLMGSGVVFDSLAVPVLYELVFTKERRSLHQGWKQFTSSPLSSGDFVYGRMFASSPEDKPIMRIQVQDVMPGEEEVPLLGEEDGFRLVISFTDQATQVVHRLYVSHENPPSSSSPSGPFTQVQISSSTTLSPAQKQSLSDAGFVWVGDFGPYQMFTKSIPPAKQELDLMLGTFEGINSSGQLVKLSLQVRGTGDWHEGAREARFEFVKKPFEMQGILSKKGEFLGRYRGSSESRQVFVRGALEGSTLTVRSDVFTLKCFRDDIVRIGIQRDWNEYWEEQRCVFSSRKWNVNVETLLSLEENSEMLGQQDNLVICESSQCRGTKQPHLSIKSFLSPAPRFLFCHIDRIKFDLQMNRAVKDLKKGPPLLAKLRVKNDFLYALSAVIVHIGNSAQSGHYVTYARQSRDLDTWISENAELEDVPESCWVLFNDAVEVRRVTFGEMVDAVERSHGTETPYILIYARCEPPHQQPLSPANLSWLVEAKKGKDRRFFETESASSCFLEAMSEFSRTED